MPAKLTDYTVFSIVLTSWRVVALCRHWHRSRIYTAFWRSSSIVPRRSSTAPLGFPVPGTSENHNWWSAFVRLLCRIFQRLSRTLARIYIGHSRPCRQNSLGKNRSDLQKYCSSLKQNAQVPEMGHFVPTGCSIIVDAIDFSEPYPGSSDHFAIVSFLAKWERLTGPKNGTGL